MGASFGRVVFAFYCIPNHMATSKPAFSAVAAPRQRPGSEVALTVAEGDFTGRNQIGEAALPRREETLFRVSCTLFYNR